MKLLLGLLLSLCVLIPFNQEQSVENKTIVYLIPGQGSDYRLYKNLTLDNNFETRHIKYHTPEKGTTMAEFAKALSSQIDTSKKFVLVGVSLGGMLATEMTSFIDPQKVIIISSAKSRNELPLRYRFQKKLPLYKILTPKMAQRGALFLQPIVEPDSKKDRDTFKSMLKDKDPKFLRRTIQMIMSWERESVPNGIIHIHGDNDHTIPLKNVSPDYVIENGSHMMALTRGEELSELINEILKE